jgi:hypothetical protein
MIRELVYTSAPKGLKPGSQGFCTVAATKGLPDLVRERIEGLSGYRVAFPAHSAQAGLNPVAWSHLVWNLGGTRQHLLSRVGYAGLDFEGRINKIAHHLLLDAADIPPGGPAWLMSQPGVMRPDWDGRVGWLPADRPLPRGDFPPRRCLAWERACGDAGWAGVLAESFLSEPTRPVYLEFTPGRDLLPLLAEAIALLPAGKRWDVTFSTYFTGLPPDVSCHWRGVLRDSPEALHARLSPGTKVIPVAPGGHAPAASTLGFVSFARTGTSPATAAVPSAEADPGLKHAEWGLSADPGFGDSVAHYAVVEDEEHGNRRKISPHHRDPRKPPPLFRQTGAVRTRWWPWMAAAVLALMIGAGGGWWLWGRSTSAPVSVASSGGVTEESKLGARPNPVAAEVRGPNHEDGGEPAEVDKPAVAIPAENESVPMQNPGSSDPTNENESTNLSSKDHAARADGGLAIGVVQACLDLDSGSSVVESVFRGIDDDALRLELHGWSDAPATGRKWELSGRKLIAERKESGLSGKNDGLSFKFFIDKGSLVCEYDQAAKDRMRDSFDAMKQCYLAVYHVGQNSGKEKICGVIWMKQKVQLGKVSVTREGGADFKKIELLEGDDYVLKIRKVDCFAFGLFSSRRPYFVLAPVQLASDLPYAPVGPFLTLGVVQYDKKKKSIEWNRLDKTIVGMIDNHRMDQFRSGKPVRLCDVVLCKEHTIGGEKLVREVGELTLEFSPSKPRMGRPLSSSPVKQQGKTE